MADGLNGQTFVQGTTYDITLTLSDPLADHALNPDGFNTSGYAITMIAKQNKSHADDDPKTISLASDRFTISTDTTASFQLLPSDTSSITINGEKSYSYEVWVTETANPGSNAYPIMSGSFKLTQSVLGG